MPIPLALVAGFLGAGKTTFLTRYARRIAPRRVAFVVNEFSETDVDTPLLAQASDDVVGISGGSIFCRCKVTDFIRELGTLSGRIAGMDGVVVEASGMADPSAAQSMLDESGLSAYYRFTGTITLVDPGTLAQVLDTLPAAERQVAAADVVVVSKCDLHDEARLAATEALVRSIAPRARLMRASHGDIDLDPLALAEPAWVDGAVAPCADPAFTPLSLPCPPGTDVSRLSTALAGLGPDLLRAKGFVPATDGWYFLDWSAGRMQVLRCKPGPPGLALIVRPAAAAQAALIVKRVADGEFTG
jgi:G3E family GTPase